MRTAEHVAELKHQWSLYQRRNALKTTAQRELIVDVFLSGNTGASHVSIDELLASVRLRNPKVGYATVYRTVKHLLDAGLAASRQFGDGQTRYEVAGSDSPHHDHLICQKCRLILEFEEPEIERLQDSVAARLGGFKVIQHKLELYGLCPKEQGVPGGNCPFESDGQTDVGASGR
ncbi:MAG TPA: transcriptional repressor [Pseudomonadota bacterium]|nr:transcriptional repressor [Pseudomonadota bacterium]